MKHNEIKEICDKIQKNGCNVGERYYRAKNDIWERKKMLYYKSEDDKGNLTEGIMEDPYKANNTLASGWLKILIDQKLNFSLGNQFTLDIDQITRNIRNGIYDTGKEASKKAIGWAYVYVKDGELKIKTIPTEQVYVEYLDEEKGIVDTAYRCYKINGVETFEIITKDYVEVYEMRDKEYVLVETRYHITKGIELNGKLTNAETKGWNNTPLIPLYNNEERMSDLNNVKGFIDIYDIVNSDFANNLEDIQDAYFVIKGFNGSNVTELLNNIKQYKVARVGEGGDAKLETQDIPHEAKTRMLELTQKNLFEFGMGFDTSTVGEGNATNYIIQMRLSNLKMKASGFEKQIQEFMFRLLPFINEYYKTSYKEDDMLIEFNREQLINEVELLNALKDQKGIISDTTLYKSHPLVEKVEDEFKNIKDERSINGLYENAE